MTSATQNPSSPSTTARSSAGSLQALNLGSLLVGQLSQAINWGNAENFQLPDCKPWVELPSNTSADQDVEEQISAHQPDQRGSEPQTNVDISVPAAAEETVLVEEAEESVLAEEATPELASQNDKEPEDAVDQQPHVDAKEQVTAAVSLPEPVAEPIESKQPEVVVQTTEPDSEPRQETPIGSEIKSEVEPPEVAPPVLDAQEARPELPARSAKPTPEPPVEQPAAQRAKEAAPVVATIAKPERQPVAEVAAVTPPEPEVRKSAPAQKPKSITESQPVRKVPLPNQKGEAARPPLMVTTPRPQSSAHTDDAYLTQLERLVLELNMELARVRGEQSDVDPMEQMANRIIALNLENLALREQLQRTASPT